jgi:hypothetical protein
MPRSGRTLLDGLVEVEQQGARAVVADQQLTEPPHKTVIGGDCLKTRDGWDR